MVFHICLDQNIKNMKKLIFLCLLFDMSSSYKTGSHSLWLRSTMVIGDTPFPEFSAVVLLDYIQVAYYDSNENNLIYRQYKSENEDEEKNEASFIFGNMHDEMKRIFSMYQLNRTHGVHTIQRQFGCELLDDDTHGLVRLWDALNGVCVSSLRFNVQQNRFEGTEHLNLSPIQKRLERNYAMYFSPLCFRVLKNCLHTKENEVMRKVKPRVRLLQKTLPSGGAKVTCLATGFYPRHINLTLLRDGQPVSDHQITGGELLPNLDGTYQMRKSLEVSTEELRVKHHYSCTAEHLSLDNKLDVKLDLDPGVGTVSIVIPVVVLGVALLCVAGAVVFMRRRRHSSTPSEYVPTQSSGDSNLEMNQNQNLEL